MCGFCIETAALSESVYDPESYNSLFGVVLLQESDDIQKTINRLSLLDDSPCPIELVFLRLWEGFIFQKNGISYEFIIDEFGKNKISELLASLKAYLPSNDFYSLADFELYTNPDVRDKFMERTASLVEGSKAILGNYLSFWVSGEGRQCSDPEGLMRETGVFDPIAGIKQNDWRYFYGFFPFVFLSFLIIKRHQPESEIIKRLALETVMMVPGFEGYDLWLQREAFESCVKEYGIQFFMDDLDRVRMGLIYRCLLRGIVKSEDMDALRDRLLCEKRGDDMIEPSEVIELIDKINSSG